MVHHANQALKAHKLFLRDRDYIVKGGEVIIIDEFTGRMMQGRRYSDGLHQALEAKEHVKIQPENQTLASITFQNYFRLYEKLAGMTGTAATEANEFLDIYKLDVARGAHQHAGGPHRRARRGLPHRRREGARHRRARSPTAAAAASRCWSAPRRSRSPSSCRPFSRIASTSASSAHTSGSMPTRSRTARRTSSSSISPTSPAISKSSAARTAAIRCRTWCSTRAITSRKPTSSPRPAFRAPSPSPPTWPAAAPTFSSAATTATARATG